MEATALHLRTGTYLGLLVLTCAVAALIALATLAFLCVVGYVLTFDRPERGSPPPETERTAAPEDFGASATS